MTASRRSIPAPAESGTRIAPKLIVGPGDRNVECVNASDCLRRFVQAHPVGRGFKEKQGHCPPLCTSLELPPSHVRLGLAAYWSADHGVERGEHEPREDEEGSSEE